MIPSYLNNLLYLCHLAYAADLNIGNHAMEKRS